MPLKEKDLDEESVQISRTTEEKNFSFIVFTSKAKCMLGIQLGRLQVPEHKKSDLEANSNSSNNNLSSELETESET